MDKKHPSSKRYPPELKERAIRMVRELQLEDPGDHGVISWVARQLGVGIESLRLWVKQAEIDAGRRTGTTSVEHDELVELRKEVKELRRSNDILQAAASFFGAELDRRHKKKSPSQTLPGTARPVGVDGGSSRSAHSCRSPHPPTTTPRPGHCRPGLSATSRSAPTFVTCGR